MVSQFRSPGALDELRRILLAPEYLSEAIRPVMADLLREQMAEIAGDLTAQMAPAIQAAIRQALHDELQELTPDTVGELAAALAPAVSELLEEKSARSHTLASLLRPASRDTDQDYFDSDTDLRGGELDVDDDVPAEDDQDASDSRGDARKATRRGRFSLTRRHFLVLWFTVLVTAASGMWCWSKVGALMMPDVSPTVQIVSGGLLMPVAHAQVMETVPPELAESETGEALEDQTPLEETLSPAPEDMALEPEDTAPASEGDTASDAAYPGVAYPGAADTDTPAEAVLPEEVAPTEAPVTATPAPAGPIDDSIGEGDPVPIDESLAAGGQVLYLTFDDGPNPEWTPQILDVLAQYDAHATFFVIGKEAERYPEWVQAEHAAGHLVGNHTWGHPYLQGASHDTFLEEILWPDDQLSDVVSTFFRPPYGYVDDDIQAWSDELGLTVVRWNIDPADWKNPSAQEIADAVIAHARPGGIVLMHDGGGDRSSTVAALPTILSTLGDQGYVFEVMRRP